MQNFRIFYMFYPFYMDETFIRYHVSLCELCVLCGYYRSGNKWG